MRKMIRKYVTWILMLALFITFMPNASVQAKTLKKWEKAYLKELKNNNLSNASAKLLYIDNDDVPEILVEGRNSKDEFTEIIYSYYNGKVYKNCIKTVEPSYSGISYVKKTGYMLLGGAVARRAFTVVSVLKKGKIYYKMIISGDETGTEFSGTLNNVWVNPKVKGVIDYNDFLFEKGDKQLNDDETMEIFQKKIKYKKSKYKDVWPEKSLKKVMKQLRHEK